MSFDNLFIISPQSKLHEKAANTGGLDTADNET